MKLLNKKSFFGFLGIAMAAFQVQAAPVDCNKLDVSGPVFSVLNFSPSTRGQNVTEVKGQAPVIGAADSVRVYTRTFQAESSTVIVELVSFSSANHGECRIQKISVK